MALRCLCSFLVLFAACSSDCGAGKGDEKAAAPPAIDEAARAAEVTRLVQAGQGQAAAGKAALLLAQARDPVAASTAVRAMAASGCAGLVRALAILDGRAEGNQAVSAPLLDGLITDALGAAEPGCPPDRARAALAEPDGAASALAFARLNADDPERALATLSRAPDVAAIHEQRAALYLELEKPESAIAELTRALSREPRPALRTRLALLHVAAGDPARALTLTRRGAGKDSDAQAALTRARTAALAALGRYHEAVQAVAGAPLYDRPALAETAVKAAPDPAALANAEDPPVEILAAVAKTVPPKAAAPLLSRAASARPDDADLQFALGNARAKAGDVDGAIEAWDRAAALAPASESLIIDPITWLAQAGYQKKALRRAEKLAREARAQNDADALSRASAAAAAAKKLALAVVLAREALAARPDDGRLVFRLAKTMAAAGRAREAIDAYARLLACGAHGGPWHRHELAHRLVELGREAPEHVRERLKNPGCEAVEPADLASYVRRIDKELR